MKKISFVFLLFFTGCYSTSIISNRDPGAVNFDSIKNGTIAVYAGGMDATFNKGVLGNSNKYTEPYDSKKRTDIVNVLNHYFESYISTIKIINDSTPLPRAYMGELNMNQEQEMDQFLSKVGAEYAFIVSSAMQNINTKSTPMNFYNNGLMMTSSSLEVDNKINISFELWDVRNKALLLDYEVTCKGWIYLNGTLQKAVEYIQQSGNCK